MSLAADCVYVCDDCARWRYHGGVLVGSPGTLSCGVCGRDGFWSLHPEPRELHVKEVTVES